MARILLNRLLSGTQEIKEIMACSRDRDLSIGMEERLVHYGLVIENKEEYAPTYLSRKDWYLWLIGER